MHGVFSASNVHSCNMNSPKKSCHAFADFPFETTHALWFVSEWLVKIIHEETELKLRISIRWCCFQQKMSSSAINFFPVKYFRSHLFLRMETRSPGTAAGRQCTTPPIWDMPGRRHTVKSIPPVETTPKRLPSFWTCRIPDVFPDHTSRLISYEGYWRTTSSMMFTTSWTSQT